MDVMEFRLLPPPQVIPPELTPEQRAVARLRSGMHVVLGGPGTGKTVTLAAAAADWVADGSGLDRLIVLAHSRAAAQTLRRDITRRLSTAQTGANVSTVHGFALGLMRRYLPHEDADWRLLRAPEQEARIRELLAAIPVEAWPEPLRPALKTRAFARQLRDVLARARQLSLDAEGVLELAAEASDASFAAAARFMEAYLTVGDFSATLDYAELVYRTRLLLTEPEAASAVRAAFDGVLVDDAHESDPAQVALLADLARLGLPVVAFGDPQQRIGGYRGATATALADLAAVDGAVVHQLSDGFRCAEAVTGSLSALTSRLPARLRPPSPRPLRDGGRVRARVFDDESAEIAHVAAELRAAISEDGLNWSDLAVVTRAGRSQLSSVAKELIRLGVPVDVAGDEIALSEQPAVGTLLLALDVAARGARPEADEARLLLSSPLAGLDGVAQRRLARALLARHRSRGGSAPLLARCLGEPALLEGIDLPEAASAAALSGLLEDASELLADDAEPQVALWGLWDGTDWPARLREQALRGNRRADADLDAIVEVFELASRMDDLRGAPGVRTFLGEIAGQEIPADTGRELDAPGNGVRLITAHRTRGLQWERVWVIRAQEGLWPRSGRQGVLLDAQRLTATQLLPPGPGEQLLSDRQLFHVACSRARTGLFVSAVQGVEGEGGRASRFLGELGVPVERINGRPAGLLTAVSLVGSLRRTLTDESASPGLRRAAALRLADLVAGDLPAPGARPASWWGTAEPTSGAAVPTGPIGINGSSLETLLECPRRWFLSRRARADAARQSRASIGDVVHLIARQAAEVGLDADQMRAELDRVWDEIPFETEWLSATERSEIDAAIGRFATYQEHEPTTLVAVEKDFRVPMTVEGHEVVLTGQVDRLERTRDGRIRVVDLKTGRKVLREADVLDHAQLGLYQLATRLGAFDDVTGGVRDVAPPALAFVRAGETMPALVSQPSIDDAPQLPGEELTVGPSWVHDRIAEGVAIIASGRFDAVECGACRYCPFASSCPALAAGAQGRPK